jgi:hypothetical protein
VTTIATGEPADGAETDPMTDPERVSTRHGFAAVSLVLSAAGAAAMCLPAGAGRLGMLLAFMLFGPGAAVMAHVRISDRLVSWALAVTTGMTLGCGVAVTMLWLHSWHPDLLAAGLITATAVTGFIPLLRYPPFRFPLLRPRPDAGQPVRPFRTPTLARPRPAANSAGVPVPARPGRWLPAVTPAVTLTVAAGLWFLTLARFNPSSVNGYGLTAALGIPFVLAVLLLGVGFTTEVFHRCRISVLVVALLLMAVILHATVPLLYGMPEYSWMYKHLGVVDLIRDNGHLLDNADIYQQWPGFFATLAVLSDTSGVEAVAFATWSALVFAVLNLLLMTALLRQFTRDRRVVALGAAVFQLGMWVDIGYFAPQAFVYTLMLGFWLIVARWLLNVPPPPDREVGRPVQFRGWLLRDLPAPVPCGRRTRMWAAIAATPVFVAITVSHQLTPFLMLAPLIVLAALGVLRPRSLVVVLGLIVGVFVSPRLSSVSHQYALFEFRVFVNVAGNARTWRTTDQVFSAVVVRSLAIGVWTLALVAVWRSRHRLGAVIVPTIIGFAPFATLVGQSYGGEAIYRVFAFSLPFAALLIAATWGGVQRNMRGTVVSGLLLAAMALATLQGLQGQLVVNQVPAADVEAARNFYTCARPGASLVLIAPNFPTRLTGNYGAFNVGRPVDLALTYDDTWLTRVDAKHLPDLELKLERLGTADNYLVVSRQMNAYVTYFGLLPKTSIPSLEGAVRASSRWRVFYSGPGVTIYEFKPGGFDQVPVSAPTHPDCRVPLCAPTPTHRCGH